MAYDAEPVGTLATLVANIQQWANETKIKSKYSASKLYPLIKANFQEVFNEIMRIADNTILVNYPITVGPNDKITLLPPNVGVIYRIHKQNADWGTSEFEVYSRSRRNPSGPVVQLEGNFLRWIPYWNSGSENLIVQYIPNGDLQLAYGTQTAPSTHSSINTLVLDTTPDEGYFDRRPGAYLGASLHVLGAGASLSEVPSGYSFFPQQSRAIKTYVANDTLGPKVTIEPDFDFDLSLAAHNGGAGFTTLQYEIVPDGLAALSTVVGWRTVMTLHAMEGNQKRRVLAQGEYASKFRDIKMTLASLDTRHGQRYEHDTVLPLSDLWAVL